jgi:hypothetical protein
MKLPGGGNLTQDVLLWGGLGIIAIATYFMAVNRIPGDQPFEDDKQANAGWFYGRPYSDRGLPWNSQGFGPNDPSARVTVA